MTAAPVPPIAYGRDEEGQPACINLDGPCPHVLIAGAAGQGLTTLVGVIAVQAARHGVQVRSCHPRDADDAWTRGEPGIMAGHGLSETIALIAGARAEMLRRFDAVANGGTRPGQYPQFLLAVDDCRFLASPAARRDHDGTAAAVEQLQEITACGRAVRIVVLLATHLHFAFPPGMTDCFGTRILLGPAPHGAAMRLLGTAAATRLVPRDVPYGPGTGIAETQGAGPAVIHVAVPAGAAQ